VLFIVRLEASNNAQTEDVLITFACKDGARVDDSAMGEWDVIRIDEISVEDSEIGLSFKDDA